MSERYPPNIDSSRCESRKSLDLIADKWTVLVIRALDGGGQRYGELVRRIDGISKKMLTQTLRELERNGLVRREVGDGRPAPVEYSLTELGETLSLPLGALAEWSMNYLAQVQSAQHRYDGRARPAA
ncbi:helix-turn-helix domain-containing protein [soil metagenome]